MPFDVIASLDLLAGQVVRLQKGDFRSAKVYGDPEEVLDRILDGSPSGMPRRLHIVDLEASRSGRPIEVEVVRRLAKRDLRVQVGGGIRTIKDAWTWLDAGAEKIVIGTIAAEKPERFRRLVSALGASRIIAAVDVRDGAIRVGGWERTAASSIAEVFALLAELGIGEALVTDISHDGMLRGPSFDLYRQLEPVVGPDGVRILASGGVTTIGDLVSLARMPAVSGAIVGKSLLEGRIAYGAAVSSVQRRNTIPERIIPCLDVRDGRVVKGVNFEGIRDAGDPVECVRRYETEGADEIVVLDISATDHGRDTALETVRRIADALFIPLTVGGGVRTLEDFRALLRAGADRVAINTAAIRDPRLISACAREFGVQAVVLSVDAKRVDGRFEAMVRSGKEASGVEVVGWCREAERRGAGEILLTSVDRDGTNAGFDIELLRAVTPELSIGVIASGGAGTLAHFRQAIEAGGARAVLAASLFHDRKVTVGEVKEMLEWSGIPVRK
jgi:imidazole glycerol-phosphate synthase subunit HisF